MAGELRPMSAVLVLLAVLLAGSIGSLIVTESGTDSDAEVTYVPLDGEETQLWLYTSRGPSFEEPTLAVNVIVYGDPDDVRRLLLEEGIGSWNKTTAEEQGITPDESIGATGRNRIEWDIAAGSDRFLYLTGQEGGVWLSENIQIHDGDYLGSRHHVRTYTPPGRNSEWTAMQAHHEYWDWFMTRHVVTSTDKSQAHVEREFADTPTTPDIKRIPASNADHRGFDPWVTIVDFRDASHVAVAVIPILLLGTVRNRVSNVSSIIGEGYLQDAARTVIVSGGIVAVFLSVRLTGVWLERSLDVPPKALAFLLYPVIFAGLPIGTYLLARPLDGTRAFSSASLGLLTAILVDYSVLGVTYVTLHSIIHLGAVAVALGCIAMSDFRGHHSGSERIIYLRFGILLWLVALLFPLLRHTPLPL